MNQTAPTTREQSREQQIEDRIDTGFARQISVSSLGGGGSFVPATLGEAMEFAKMMAISGPMVGKSFRRQPGACLGIALQAWRWEMDPFAVSQKAYTTGSGDQANIGYEAQLVAAVINTRAPLEGRLEIQYAGEGLDLKCIVSGKIIGDSRIKTAESPKLKDIKPQNSPLWKNDPRQQIAYYTIRNWGRLHVPEILLGVYDVDEMEEVARAERARDVTPRSDAKSALDQFASEPEPTISPEEQLAMLKSAVEAAKDDQDALSALWDEAGKDGTLPALHAALPDQFGEVCMLYNHYRETPSESRTDAPEEPADDEASTACGMEDDDEFPGDKPNRQDGLTDEERAAVEKAAKDFIARFADTADMGKVVKVQDAFMAAREEMTFSDGQIREVNTAKITAQKRLKKTEGK